MTTKQERLESYSLDKLRKRRDTETAEYSERLYHEITYTGPMVHHLAVVEAFEWAVSEIERLRDQLAGARKMACDLCSRGVTLRPDGYHQEADFPELQWCQAEIREEPSGCGGEDTGSAGGEDE